MIGKCAHREVIAIIENNGWYFIGSNWCRNAQEKCPRSPEEVGDYEKCRTVCHQYAHAEISACEMAMDNAEGGTLYLIGHDHYCDECKAVMDNSGIKEIVIGQFPPSWRGSNG